MRRMTLRPGRFTPSAADDVVPIGEEDLAAVSALYEDGRSTGEQPTFFHAGMLAQRTFRGLWEHGALVSVAGTHLYSRDLGICTIGNVYTRRDRRGRGLGARVTSAVAAHAINERVPTIVLNVARDNVTAQRVYERLGFDTHCAFVEGEAMRVDS
jgi:predicted GNAT family acetyltransferase